MRDSKKIEYVDVLDEHGNKTDEQKTIAEVHRDGDWHYAVHVWIVNSRKELLLQHRAPHVHVSPGLWDASVGGHVSAGDNLVDTAVEEAKEEIGLSISPDELEYLFTVNKESIREEEGYYGRHVMVVYLIYKDVPLSAFSFRDGEVTEVKYVTLDEFQSIITSKKQVITSHPEEYKRLIQKLKGKR